MIRAKNINFTIGNKKILSEINIEIKSQKITTILGANGAGKSTLLKCLTGILPPNQGEVILDNKNLSDYSLQELAKKRAVFSQGYEINFPFTAFEIINMGRNPYFYENTQDEKIIDEILYNLDALHLKNRLFPTLSGGEQQRIHLARVLAQIWQEDNAYLFLDEPTSALDLKHQHQILQLAVNLVSQKKLTICAIMHDINLAQIYSDEIILIKNGKIVDFGSKENLLTKDNISRTFDIANHKSIDLFLRSIFQEKLMF